MTGHSYVVYGPLCNSHTSILFESIPSYPAFDRFWAVCEKYNVNNFYTAPTVIRSMAKEPVEESPAPRQPNRGLIIGIIVYDVAPAAKRRSAGAEEATVSLFFLPVCLSSMPLPDHPSIGRA